MTILTWLLCLASLIAVVIVGLCQISRQEARRRRHEDMLMRACACRHAEDEWAEMGIGRERR